MAEKRINSILSDYIKEYVIGTFDAIPESKKSILQELTAFLKNKLYKEEIAEIVFVCTHNSRRSQMSQIWAHAAAVYYGITGVKCYSGGTEETAFNPRSVKVLQKSGFIIKQISRVENSLYHIYLSEGSEPILGFSKEFAHIGNPQSKFCAIMTCTDADEACPFVPGAEKRISLPYEDPKRTDGTSFEEQAYHNSSLEIAREMFFVFYGLSEGHL